MTHLDKCIQKIREISLFSPKMFSETHNAWKFLFSKQKQEEAKAWAWHPLLVLERGRENRTTTGLSPAWATWGDPV